MSKQVTASELAEIVTRLLTASETTGELDGHETFQSFMTDIAQVVCDHCGGELHYPADSLDDIWYVGIHGNESLPDAFGGIWRECDKEGDLFAAGTAEWFEAKFGDEHPEWPKAEWQQDVSNLDTKLGYWDWVAHNVESASNNSNSDVAEAASETPPG